MQRPTGVTVLAILQFLGAAFCALFGLLLFVGGSFIGGLLGSAGGQEATSAGLGMGLLIGAVGGVIFLVVAGLYGVVGWGMWSLKNWARIVTLVLASIGALFQVMGVLGALVQFKIGSLLWSVIVLGINAAIIWYLMQPQVKAAFAEAPPVQTHAAGM